MTMTTTAEGEQQQDLEVIVVEEDECVTIKTMECNVRKKYGAQRWRPGMMVLTNTLATAAVFVLYLISIETLISIGLSVGATIYIYERILDEQEHFQGATLNWVLLSFAVVTPMSAAIVMAFRRREQALRHIAKLRAIGMELFLCHTLWDWYDRDGVSGKSKSSVDWKLHSDGVLELLLGIFFDMSRYFTLPNASRARHKIFNRQEASDILEVAAGLHEQIVIKFVELAKFCEILKREGLPPNEATRIRQWERALLEEMEQARMIKRYRTPQGLRSFGRLFSVFMPAFYAPYFAQLAIDLNSLGFAIAFSSLTSIALTALFETVSQMEDPFLGQTDGLDGIHVAAELFTKFRPRLLRLRSAAFPQTSPFPNREESLNWLESLTPVSRYRIFTQE